VVLVQTGYGAEMARPEWAAFAPRAAIAADLADAVVRFAPGVGKPAVGDVARSATGHNAEGAGRTGG